MTVEDVWRMTSREGFTLDLAPQALPDLGVRSGLQDVQAAPLPGDDRALAANPWSTVALWALASLVTSIFIGLPLVVVLVGPLGSALAAVAVAAGVVALLTISLRVLLARICRTIAPGRARSAA